jgi:hypothetical protein
MKRRIKNNRFVRGLYFFIQNYFSAKRNSFGYMADSVTVTPPMFLVTRKIFLFSNMLVLDQIVSYQLQTQNVL